MKRAYHRPEFYADRIDRLEAQIERLEKQIVELAQNETAARAEETALTQERQESIARRQAARRDRVQQIRDIAAEHPDWNLTDIGTHIGVTRERIRQLANEHDIAVSRGGHKLPPKLCEICAKPLPDRRRMRHLACSRMQLVCTGCGVTFTRKRSEQKRRATSTQYASTDRIFHSRECLHAWKKRMGSDWFVRRHPKDWGFGKRKSA